MRTIVLKLQPTAEQAAEMDATLLAFARASDYIADVARREHTTNKVLIQRVFTVTSVERSVSARPRRPSPRGVGWNADLVGSSNLTGSTSARDPLHQEWRSSPLRRPR